VAGRYDHLDAVEDIPTAFYYKEMLEQYPNSSFILTLRNPEDWYVCQYVLMYECMDVCM
jgi:hypothetical protein